MSGKCVTCGALDEDIDNEYICDLCASYYYDLDCEEAE